jgi:hypothetical protein
MAMERRAGRANHGASDWLEPATSGVLAASCGRPAGSFG